jgi:tetratricopeptide (TPR) repeat protein
MSGDFLLSDTAYQHSLAQWEAHREEQHTASSTQYAESMAVNKAMIGRYSALRGEYEQFDHAFREALRESQGGGLIGGNVLIPTLYCYVSMYRRPTAPLRHQLLDILKVAKEWNSHLYAIYTYKCLALVELAIGTREDALSAAQAGYALAKQFGLAGRQGELLTVLAQITMRAHEYTKAEALLVEALDLEKSGSQREEYVTTLYVYGELLLFQKQLNQAATTFREALQAAPQGHEMLRGLAYYGLARVTAAQGHKREALIQGRKSLQIFEQLDYAKASEVRQWVQAQSFWQRWRHPLPVEPTAY